MPGRRRPSLFRRLGGQIVAEVRIAGCFFARLG
jgi:hypothetical protein